jgi:7-cyano-7-deazaguanine synthase in queuosine biosynthesis
MPMKAVVLCRGGLASAVLAYLLGKEDPARARSNGDSLPSTLRQARGLAPEGYTLHLLTIRDGRQPGQQAQHAARLIAAVLDTSYHVLDPAALLPLPALVAASPHARLFALAGVVAVREGAAVVVAGVTKDSSSGSEAVPTFVTRFNEIAEHAEAAIASPRLCLLTPLAGSALADLVALGAQLGVPLESTWSCTAGFALHCGRCAACRARQAAFHQAGVPDQTRYGAPTGASACRQVTQKGG